MFEKNPRAENSGENYSRSIANPNKHRMLRNSFIDSQWARQAGFLIGDVYDEF